MFPSRSGHNAYIDLFTRALHGSRNDRFTCIVSPRSFTGLLGSALLRPFQKHIVHIHWPIVLYGSKYLIKSIFLLGYRFSALFILKYFFRCRIVWTKHNEHAHDYPHPWIDRMGSRILLRLADAVIVHQASAVNTIHHRNVRHIPHGNYCDVYGRIDQSAVRQLRQTLDITDCDIVLLALGTVKPYKKIDGIIDVLNTPSLRALKNLKLVIAGECKAKYRAVLQERIHGNPQIILKPEYIHDEEVAAYLGIADYAIFWYDDSVLTSGGIVLALSYGLPVIARNIPAADMIVHGENGLLYETMEDLMNILLRLPSREPMNHARILESVSNQNWKECGKKTTALYSSLFM